MALARFRKWPEFAVYV